MTVNISVTVCSQGGGGGVDTILGYGYFLIAQ